jgi:hypothetical protein
MHALALSSDVLNSFSLVKVLCADTENRTLARIDTTNHGVSASSKRAVRLLSSEFLGSCVGACIQALWRYSNKLCSLRGYPRFREGWFAPKVKRIQRALRPASICDMIEMPVPAWRPIHWPPAASLLRQQNTLNPVTDRLEVER